VVWLSAEEHPAEVIVPRLDAAGAVLSRVHFPDWLRAGSRASLRFPTDLNKVAGIVARHNATLLILDTVNGFLDAGLEGDAPGTARIICEGFYELSTNKDFATLLIRHDRKDPRGPARHRSSGSAEWTNFPRCALTIGQDPADEEVHILVASKHNLCPNPPAVRFRIVDREGYGLAEFLGHSELSAEDVVQPKDGRTGRMVYLEARSLIIDLLSEGERRSKDVLRIAEEAGISRAVLWDAKSDLGILSKPRGSNADRFHVWLPPDGGFPK